eukprot:ANDGO_07732.mRNA.1 U3 small nucleolar RNA-associated protein MPP10
MRPLEQISSHVADFLVPCALRPQTSTLAVSIYEELAADAKTKKAVDHLVTDQMDAEQIWAQISMLNNPVLQKAQRKIDEFHFSESESESEAEAEAVDHDDDNGDNDDGDDVSVGEDEDGDDNDENDDEDDENDLLDREFKNSKKSTGKRELAHAKANAEFFSESDMMRFLEEQDHVEDEDREDEDEDEDFDPSEVGYETFFGQKQEDQGEQDQDQDEDEDEQDPLGSQSGKNADRDEKEQRKVKALLAEAKKKSLFDDEDEKEMKKLSQEDQTRFQRQLASMLGKISQLEEENLQKKTWTLRGEIGAKERPKNSLLEVDIDFDLGVSTAPRLVTEEENSSIEELIKMRIKTQLFDDPVRIEAPSFETEKEQQKVNDQKDSRGLGEVYEEEFAKALAGKPTSNPLHLEIATLFQKVAYKLDAMAGFSYVPKPISLAGSLERPQSVAAIQSDQLVPDAVGSLNMVAPQEVFDPRKEKREKAQKRKERIERNNKAPSLDKVLSRRGDKLFGKKKTGKNAPVAGAETKFGRSTAVFRKLQEDVQSTLHAERNHGAGRKRGASSSGGSSSFSSSAPTAKVSKPAEHYKF